jgi:putative oxidoreductase
MDPTFANVLVTLGQLLLGALYVWAALNHFGPGAEKIVPILESRGVPMPREALYVASVFELICGACLMLGIAVAPAAIALALFTIVASFVLVNFWDRPEGEMREALKGVFVSNAAIVGGLLLAAAGAP